MSFDNTLGLVIEIDTVGANGAILGLNQNMSVMERQAVSSAKNMSGGVNAMGYSFRESREASRLLGEEIGIRLPRAVSGFLARAESIGPMLASAFNASVYVAIGMAIYESGKKLYEWVEGSKAAAEATKELNKEIQTQTELFDKNAKAIEEATRRNASIGLSGTQKAGMEVGFKKSDLDVARIELDALSGQFNRLYLQAQKVGVEAGFRGAAYEKAMKDYVDVQDKMNAAEQKYKLALIEVAGAQKQIGIEINKNAEAASAAIVKEMLAQDAAIAAVYKGVVATPGAHPTGLENLGAPQIDYSHPAMPTFDVTQMTKDILVGLETATKAEDEAWGKSWASMQDLAFKRIADIKDAAGHIFDDLMMGSKSIWEDLKRSFFNIFLTPVRMAFQNLAVMLFGGGGGSPAGATAGAGGGGGGLGGVLGGIVPFIGRGGGGSSGSGGGTGGLGSLLNLGGLKSFFGFGNGADFVGPTQEGSLGGSLSKLGGSNAAMLGGGLLAMNGLQRGGMLGMAETTAGGALIGFRFGGPMGAAIGAGAGALAGLVRLFVKGATDKAHEKIKATYGVDVTDKGVLQQVVDIAKQGFGGNLDMAIRSQQIADLVRLYAMSTGQGTGGLRQQMMPSTLIQSGGGLSQLPGSGLNQTYAGAGAGAVNVTINLSPEAAQNLLTQGVLRAVKQNPGAMQAASVSATKSSISRRQLSALQLSPGTLTS